MKNEDIKKLREVMGTTPIEESKVKTPFYRGVKDIKVELIDYPTNPYKPLVLLATSCWGDKINKWKDLSIEGRLYVVLAVLKRMALPLAYESISFTFAIEDVSRWCFDQIARARVGAVFSSMGTRDNDHKGLGFRVSSKFYEDPSQKELVNEYLDALKKCKEVYGKIVDSGKSNWQVARDILPISSLHRFSMAMNFAALQNFCSRRMKFCEADQTVAVAWLVREEIKKKFPLLAHYLRPGCDFSKICQYHKTYSMSEAFGCLFKECGRNECKAKDDYSIFNHSCSDKKQIESELNIRIPDNDYWKSIDDDTFIEEGTIDRKYFEES